MLTLREQTYRPDHIWCASDVFFLYTPLLLCFLSNSSTREGSRYSFCGQARRESESSLGYVHSVQKSI